jgi:hypothetical protein
MGCLTIRLHSMQSRTTWRMSHEATIINTTDILKSPTLSIPHPYHSSSLHLSPSVPPSLFSLSLSHPPSLSPPLLVTSLSLFLPPLVPLYSAHSHPPIISYFSPLSFCFSTYLSNTHPLYFFIPII